MNTEIFPVKDKPNLEHTLEEKEVYSPSVEEIKMLENEGYRLMNIKNGTDFKFQRWVLK
mgnify:CR=1 FL=1